MTNNADKFIDAVLRLQGEDGVNVRDIALRSLIGESIEWDATYRGYAASALVQCCAQGLVLREEMRALVADIIAIDLPDWTIDFPKAPGIFGSIIRQLVDQWVILASTLPENVLEGAGGEDAVAREQYAQQQMDELREDAEKQAAARNGTDQYT